MMIKFILFAFVLLLSASGFSQTCSKDRFINELINTGDDFRAVTLLKEQEFKNRGTKSGLDCGLVMLKLYLNHEEFDSADSLLSTLLSNYPSLSKTNSPERLKAEMAYLFGNYQESLLRLKNSSADNSDLVAFSSAANRPFDYHIDENCNKPSCNELKTALLDIHGLHKKSPQLALALGIIPGMGQVYVGRTWSGAASFVVNSVLIGTTLGAFHNDEKAFGSLLALGTAGIYLGSIYAGYESAVRYNDELETSARNKIRSLDLNLQLLKLSF